MRAAIRKRLLARIGEVNGRLYEPYVAGATAVKPYLVLKANGDQPSKMSYGYNVPFEVWMYVERTSQVALDQLGAKVINALNRKEMITAGGQTFELRYAGCSMDYYDPDLDALTRRLDFSTSRIIGG